MEKEKRILSSVPISKLYGVDASGNLFIMTPREVFQVIREHKEGITPIESLTNLDIQGNIDTIYSVPEFGDVLESSVDIILEKELSNLKNIRNHILEGEHYEEEK